MEQHFQEIMTSARVSHTFTNFHMHEFIQKSKRKTAQGNCLILQWSKQESTGSIFYLKMNNFEFCKRISESTFIRVRYLKSSSYLFFNQFEDNLVYTISILNQSPDMKIFEDVLGKNGTLTDYQSPSLKYQVKVRIDFHIDQVLQNEIIINFNKATKVGKAIGSFFGQINKKIVKKAAEVEVKYQDELKRVSRQSFSDSTRSKWDRLVQKASGLNDKITEVIKPLSETVSKAVSDVSQKYSSSTNQYVKAVREFTKEAQDSINQGYQCEPQPKAGNNQSGDFPASEDNSVNLMGQHLILNEDLPEKSPYPDV